MPNHVHKNNKHVDSPRPSHVSIFNNINIKIDPKATQIGNNETKQEAGCSSCFDAIMRVFRR